jgi:hypothetical protein
MDPVRICRHSEGDNKSLLKVKGKVTNSHNGPGMRQKQRACFLFPGTLKT